MKIKKQLVVAALSGIASGSAMVAATDALAIAKGNEKCWGINGCKNHHGCGVNKAQIKAANLEFNNKFSKSIEHNCANQGNCGAKSKNLNWVEVPAGKCKDIAGGFKIQKSNGGYKIVK